MRFHVFGLVHCPTSKKHCACAYTQKVYKFCKMMKDRGHEVHHYGVVGSDPPCDTHTDVINEQERQEFWGSVDETKSTYPIDWSSNAPYWKLAEARATMRCQKRLQKHDFLCFISGSQKPIHDNLQPMGKSISVEFGIGYYGPFAPHKVFESYSHMHSVYAQFRDASAVNGQHFDAVIPNYYDPADFTVVERPEGEPYALYVGRMIARKGIEIAVEATRRAGVRLVMVGQMGNGCITNGVLSVDGLLLKASHVHFAGHADVAQRDRWMGNATCLVCPTIYLEPFGGVGVEAQMCGTPVVSSDFGAFPETVDHGATGWRCSTIEQYEWAVRNCDRFNRKYIAARARKRYGLERVGQLYEEYFQSLLTLWGEGMYSKVERGGPWLRP